MSNEGKKTFELKAYKHVNGKPDIRRFVLDATSETLHDDLVSKLSRAFKEDAALMHLYWKDSENEFVSLETDDDLQVAFSFANGSLLKVFVVKAGEKHVAEEFGDAATPSVTSSSDQKSVEFEVRGGVHHPHVVCDGCNSAIYGRRFKCVECADFDLCERCELVNNRHPDHNMMLIRRPSSRGCPYMFNGRNRAFFGPTSYPGCPMGRGPHCGRFSQTQAKQAEAPSAEQSNAEEELRLRFAEMLRSAQNGEFPAVLAAVNEVLRPLGADLSVQVDAPVQRSDSATATDKGSNDNADSSEQAGTPMGNGAEQASQTQPQSSSTTSVETSTVHVETTDKPTCTESQHTASVSTSTGSSAVNELYGDVIKQLLDMGFDNSNGWLERLVHAKKGNFTEVLDLLLNK